MKPMLEREELTRKRAQREAEDECKKDYIMELFRQKLSELRKRPDHIQEMREQSFLPEPSQIHKFNVFYSSGNFPAQTTNYMQFTEPDPPSVSCHKL